jgi:hypothetical protein
LLRDRICARRPPPFEGPFALAPPLVAALVTRPARPLLSTHRFGDPSQFHVMDDRVDDCIALRRYFRQFFPQFVLRGIGS